MKHLNALIIEKTLPEAELIAGELEQLGCAVTSDTRLPEDTGRYEIVILPEEALPAYAPKHPAEKKPSLTAVISAFSEADGLDREGLIVFHRPLDIASFANAVIQPFRKALSEEEALSLQVGAVLEAMGYPRGKTGFDCLRDALTVLLETEPEKAAKLSLRNDVFPRSAGRTSDAAEKAVARINEEVWSNAPEPLILEVFGAGWMKNGKLPGVKKVVFRLAEYLRSRPYEELKARLSACYDTSLS